MARASKRKKRSGKAQSLTYPSGGASPRLREAYWREIMRRWERSGLTQAEFCRGESLSLSAFRWWRSELKRRDRRRPRQQSAGRNGNRSAPGESISLIPVEVIASTADKTRNGFLEVVLRGERRIRVGSDFDAGTLERMIALLERLPC